MRSQTASSWLSTPKARSWARYDSSFGSGWIGWSGDDEVDQMLLPGGARPGRETTPPPALVRLAEQLEAYFAGRGALPDGTRFIPAAASTALDAEIYAVVASIPAGHTLTYAQVAARVGRPGAARAVGSAMARNRYAPVIPCHRVVGSDGMLRGYAGGIELKRSMLEMEADSD